MIKAMLKKKVLWLFVASIILFFVGLILSNPVETGFCFADFKNNIFDTACLNLAPVWGVGLFFGMIALAVASAAMLFAPKAVSVWAKFSALFALWYVYAIVSSAPRPGMFTNIGMSSADNATWLSGIYVVVTFGIIAWVYRKKK